MAGGEGLDLVADGVQALQLRSEIDSARGLGRPPKVEAGDTDGIASSNDSVCLLIIEDPGEHAIQVLRRVDTILHILSRVSLSILYTGIECLEIIQRIPKE